jgi:5-methylcytosine-specific restriction endonuclease McrA
MAVQGGDAPAFPRAMLSCMSDPRSTRRWRNLRLLILARDHHTCALCLGLANHVDHIIPLSRGGAMWDPFNLRTLCRRCSLSLGGKLAQEMYRGVPGRTGAGPRPRRGRMVRYGAIRP